VGCRGSLRSSILTKLNLWISKPRLMKKSNVQAEKATGSRRPADDTGTAHAGRTGDGDRRQLRELKERAAKADEHWERLLRTSADFDNFKKRAAREKQGGD